MNNQDLYLLLPELTMAGLAILIIVLDLITERKRILAVTAILGLSIPLIMTTLLWGSVHDPATGGPLEGLFGTLVVDDFALFFKYLVIGTVALVMLASMDYMHQVRRFQGEYYGLMILSAIGMMLLAATRDFISIYVALELTSLPLAALAAFIRSSRSTEAGIKFLLLSALSSAVLLYGMALVFGFTGTVQLSGIAQAIKDSADAGVPFGSYALMVGIVLMVAGFSFKISSVPSQMWVPDVYEGAPTPITALLSVASKAAGFAVILRVFYEAFEFVSIDWANLFAILSVLSMSVGNLIAISQKNIKRMLAYSTIAHAGYITVGLAAITSGSPDQGTMGPSGILFYLAAYAVTNLAAFFAIIVISNKTGSEFISDYAGIGTRAPVLGVVLALSMISLIGLPPTAGFIAKLYIFNAAIHSDLVWLAMVGMINSVISAYYYLRVIKVLYLSNVSSHDNVPSPRSIHLAMAICSLGIIVIGLYPGPLLRMAQAAVGPLLP